MSRRLISTFLLLGALGLPALAAPQEISIVEQPGKVRVEIRGKLFTEYCFQGAPHVYFHPLLGPGDVPMTRQWPMKDVPGEEHDHPHHRSLWFSHGAVNGVDFWAETPKSGRIVHDRFLEIRGGTESGVIRSANNWIAPDGRTLLTDERTFRVYAGPETERVFDFEITLKAGGQQVVLGDTKEGSMAIRIHEQMRLSHGKGKPGQGHIVLSTGQRDNQTWGRRAAWCDYHGPIDGKVLGVAILDHPSNPRHPTWWHVRDYGLFAANPFGRHEFEKASASVPPGAGDLIIAAHGSVTFRYRFYLHAGNELESDVAGRFEKYAAQK